METIIINAFGYEHEIVDSYLQEEIAFINGAPFIYMLLGNDNMIDAFVLNELLEDQFAVWTQADELLIFTYEEMTEKQYELLEVLGLDHDLDDQSGEPIAA